MQEVQELHTRSQAAYKEYISTRDQSKLQEAIAAATKTAQMLPKNLELQISLANLHYIATDDRSAEKYARHALDINPSSPVALKFLGRVLVQQGRQDEGIILLQQSLVHAPADGEVWYKIGAVLFEAGDLELAARCFHAAAAIRNDPLDWLSTGHTLHKLGSPSAYPAYRASVRADPTFHDAWHDLAFALGNDQFHYHAEMAARQALAVRETGENLFGVANHVMSQKRFAEAAQIYAKGAALSPTLVDLHHNWGFACHLSGDRECAIRAALRTCELWLSGQASTIDGSQQGRAAMYIAGLGHALRRADALKLAVQVMGSLKQPHQPGGSVVKQIINDNIRIDREVAANAMESVRQWLKSAPDLSDPIATLASPHPAVTLNPLPSRSELVPHAVITYLIGRKREHWLDLLDSLRSLALHLLARWPYPVVIFHEGLSAEDMERLRQIYPQLSFHRLDKSFLFPPNHVNLSHVPKIIGGHASVGYRHMCRFFSGSMFNYPLLAQYEWWMRMDSDSFLLGDVQVDPFARMRDNGYVYGYMALGREDDYLTTGLWAAAHAYMKKAGIDQPTPLLSKFLDDETGDWDRSYFYTNFEIGHLPFFRSEAYQSFFRHLDKEGGFYYYRWGDAPIRLLGVALHSEPGSVFRFGDIPYSHKVYVLLPDEGEE